MRRFSMIACAAALALAAFGAAVMKAQCTPPEEMRAKVTGKEVATALDDIGVWFAQREQYACAAQAFATSLSTDPAQEDLRHVIFMFGASLYYSGEMKEASEAFAEAERLGYRDAKLPILMAAALDAQRDTEGAEAEWRKALEFDPESTAALDALSNDMITRREYQETVDLLDKKRGRALRNERQIRNMGTALVRLGRAEEATSVLEDGLNTYPDSQEIAHQLADVLTGLHREDEAALVLRLAEEEREKPQEPAR